MRGLVVALGAAIFATTPGHAQDAASGEKIFVQCKACHQIGENAKNAVGPMLNGLFGRTVQLEGGGSVVVDEAYIRESIVNPGARITANFQPVMPTYQGVVSEDGLLQLIEYVKSLGPGGAR